MIIKTVSYLKICSVLHSLNQLTATNCAITYRTGISLRAFGFRVSERRDAGEINAPLFATQTHLSLFIQISVHSNHVKLYLEAVQIGITNYAYSTRI